MVDDADKTPADRVPTPPKESTPQEGTSGADSSLARDKIGTDPSSDTRKPAWWQSAAQHWALTTAVIAVVGAVGSLAAWTDVFRKPPEPVTMPTPQVTVQVAPALAGPNDSQPIAQNPEPVPGQSACRDSPDDSSGLGGWGPPRNLLAEDRFSEFPSFNIDDISPYGNERWFLDGKDMALPKDSPWQSKIKVERGRTYILRAYIHNSADESDEGVAKDTRIAVNLPTCTGRRIASTMTVSSSNTEPRKIWDSIHFVADDPFNLAYIPGSAVLCNNFYSCERLSEGENDGAEISNDFLTSTGALIGFDALDGLMRGGYKHSAYFYFEVRPQFVPTP